MTYPGPNEPQTRHPLLDRLGRHKSLIVVAGVVVLAGMAIATFAFGRGEHRPVTVSATQMQLAVVAPVEPTVQPGERMEVGVLSDGFDGKLPAAPPRDDDPWLDQPAYVETGWGSDPGTGRADRRREATSAYGDPLPPPPRDPPPQYRADPRAFGFDQPQPDYQAQREARRAALDARIEEERRNPRRVYSSNGPTSSANSTPDPDSEFY